MTSACHIVRRNSLFVHSTVSVTVRLSLSLSLSLSLCVCVCVCVCVCKRHAVYLWRSTENKTSKIWFKKRAYIQIIRDCRMGTKLQGWKMQPCILNFEFISIFLFHIYRSHIFTAPVSLCIPVSCHFNEVSRYLLHCDFDTFSFSHDYLPTVYTFGLSYPHRQRSTATRILRSFITMYMGVDVYFRIVSMIKRKSLIGMNWNDLKLGTVVVIDTTSKPVDLGFKRSRAEAQDHFELYGPQMDGATKLILCTNALLAVIAFRSKIMP